jgi:hypothetical protein
MMTSFSSACPTMWNVRTIDPALILAFVAQASPVADSVIFCLLPSCPQLDLPMRIPRNRCGNGQILAIAGIIVPVLVTLPAWAQTGTQNKNDFVSMDENRVRTCARRVRACTSRACVHDRHVRAAPPRCVPPGSHARAHARAHAGHACMQHLSMHPWCVHLARASQPAGLTEQPVGQCCWCHWRHRPAANATAMWMWLLVETGTPLDASALTANAHQPETSWFQH